MAAIFRFFLKTIPRPMLISISNFVKVFLQFLFRGGEVECPVCERQFRKFLPYGRRRLRPNALCPNCLSLERHRLMWLYLKNKTDFFDKPHRVLHVAPEQCFYKEFKKQQNLEYTSADLESPLADLRMDLHQILFGDNTFDVIFCSHVLEHVQDDRKCMNELYRVLRPGGFAIMQVPIDSTRLQTYEDSTICTPEDRENHYWQKDHFRLYGEDYPLRLSEAGFDVTKECYVRELGEELCERYRISSSEVLYVGRKANEEVLTV